MSSALAYTYHDPYKLPAGFLALAAHAFFFALLYFGVKWQAQPPQGMEVELWSDLPELNVPAARGAPQQKMEPVPKSEPVKPRAQEQPAAAKADIELAKKKKQPLNAETVKPQRPLTKAEKKKAQADMQELLGLAQGVEQQAQARQAAGVAAIKSEMDKYKQLIQSKIRAGLVLPPNVADNALAIFIVTLLPDGSVLDVKLRKSSGNMAYDDAVERAIRKANTLPLPTDEAARQPFINPNQLTLKFSPKD